MPSTIGCSADMRMHLTRRSRLPGDQNGGFQADLSDLPMPSMMPLRGALATG
jgi:hypothetical protein